MRPAASAGIIEVLGLMAEQTNNHISDEHISDYLDGQLVDREAETAIERHLAECDACRSRLEDFRLISGMLSTLPEPELPRSFRLTASDLEEPAPTPIRPVPWYVQFQPMIQGAAAVAASVLVLVVGFGLFFGDETDETGTRQFTAVEDESDRPASDEPDVSAEQAEPGLDDAEADAEAVPEADQDQDAAGVEEADPEAPASEPDEAPSIAEDRDGEMEAASPAALKDTEDGISQVWILAIGLAAVTGVLVLLGFVLPARHQRSSLGERNPDGN